MGLLRLSWERGSCTELGGMFFREQAIVNPTRMSVHELLPVSRMNIDAVFFGTKLLVQSVIGTLF